MMTFDVTDDAGGTYRVTAASRDVLAWEMGGQNSFGELVENLTMVGVYQLAHAAACRQGLFAGTLGEFEAQVDITLADVGDDYADPTRSEPMPESSFNWLSPPASAPRLGQPRAHGPSRLRWSCSSRQAVNGHRQLAVTGR